MEPNAVLRDPIRHNIWATGRLIGFCRDQHLTADQLEATGVGTYGTILATLHHIVRCDGGYLSMIAGNPIDFVESPEPPGFADLERWNTEAGVLWEQLLAKAIDVDGVVVINDGTQETSVGVLLAQAINHANHHREQVCAILTGLGIQPPDIQAWAYAWTTGRIRDRDRL